MSWFAVSDSGCPSDQTSVAVGIPLDAEQPVGIESNPAVAEHCQLMKGIANHEPFSREGGIEPVQRGLPFLEVVEVHPTTAHAVGTSTTSVALQSDSLTPGA